MNSCNKSQIFAILSSFFLVVIILSRIIYNKINYKNKNIVNNSPSDNKTNILSKNQETEYKLLTKIDESNKLNQEELCIIRFDENKKTLLCIKKQGLKISKENSFVKFEFDGQKILFFLEFDHEETKISFDTNSPLFGVDGGSEILISYENKILKCNVRQSSCLQMQQSRYAELYRTSIEKDIFYGCFEENNIETLYIPIFKVQNPPSNVDF